MRWNRTSSMFAGVAMMLVCCVCMMGCASLGAAQSPPGFTHLSAAQFDQANYRAPLVEIQINSPADVIELEADPFNLNTLKRDAAPVKLDDLKRDTAPVFDDRPVIHTGKFVSNAVYHPSDAVVANTRTVVHTTPVSHRVYTRSSCQTNGCLTKTVSKIRHYRVYVRSRCCN